MSRAGGIPGLQAGEDVKQKLREILYDWGRQIHEIGVA